MTERLTPASLDPAVLAATADLELVARVIVEGTVTGLHRSPFHGYSAEFSQYRHYRPGDDPKYVDWKLFGRTDRVYTKMFRETTNTAVQIVVDASASMGYTGREGIAKIDYARIVAGALAHLVSRQGDAVGLVVFDEVLRGYLPGRTGTAHLRRVLVTLAQIGTARRTSPAAALRRSVDLMRRRGVIVLLSDLYDDEEGVQREVTRAVRMGHEMAIFHVLTPAELQFAITGDVELRDLETGATTVVSGAGGDSYRHAMQAFIERWRSRCAAHAVEYVPVRTDAAPEGILRRYLLARGRRPRR